MKLSFLIFSLILCLSAQAQTDTLKVTYDGNGIVQKTAISRLSKNGTWSSVTRIYFPNGKTGYELDGDRMTEEQIKSFTDKHSNSNITIYRRQNQLQTIRNNRIENPVSFSNGSNGSRTVHIDATNMTAEQLKNLKELYAGQKMIIKNPK